MDINQHNLDLISDIYEIALDSHKWRSVLDRLGREAGALAVNTLLVDHTNPEIQVNATSSLFTEADILEFHENHLEQEAPAIMALRHHQPGEYFSDRHFFQFVGLDAENVSSVEWLRRRFGVGLRVGTRLNGKEAWLDCLTFHYALDRPYMRDEEKREINIYRPHFARLMEITRPFNLLQARFRAVLSVLDRFHIGTFILSEEGAVVVCNREAERILDQKDGLSLAAGHKLGCFDDTDRQRLGQTIKRACATAAAKGISNGELLTIGRRSGQDPYLVDIAPLRGTELVLESGFKGALVLITDPSNEREVSAEGLRLLYGLSEAEEAICRMVVNGMRNDQIAESRNVSLDTIKTQMKSLYSKTGTNHRLELLRLAQNVDIPVDKPDGG